MPLPPAAAGCPVRRNANLSHSERKITPLPAKAPRLRPRPFCFESTPVNTTTRAAWRHRAAVTLHTVAAVAGGWGVMALAVPLSALALAAAGMARSEATVLAMMLGFVAYLVLVLWAFSVRLVRLVLVLSVAAAVCGGLLHLLT